MKKRLILTILLAVVALTSLGIWGDLFSARAAMADFPWYWLPVIAFFGFMNDFIKFFRWHLYLRKMGIALTWHTSLNIFLAGLSMSATPGKVGLLLKSHMLEGVSGRRLLATSPVILAELYMDLLGLTLISLAGYGLLDAGKNWPLLILCAVPLLGLVPRIPEAALRLVARVPRLAGRAGQFEKALDDMFALFGTRLTLGALLITLLAWTSEGVALSLIIKGLGFEMGILPATVIFGFSTLVGALSMLPGGLVVTDASLMGLLVHAGIPGPQAALAAILARIFTLWLAVMVGSIMLLRNREHLGGYKGELNQL